MNTLNTRDIATNSFIASVAAPVTGVTASVLFNRLAEFAGRECVTVVRTQTPFCKSSNPGLTFFQMFLCQNGGTAQDCTSNAFDSLSDISWKSGVIAAPVLFLVALSALMLCLCKGFKSSDAGDQLTRKMVLATILSNLAFITMSIAISASL